jgi:two-component system cell cycle sensor histidine kinase/response regulator CckA
VASSAQVRVAWMRRWRGVTAGENWFRSIFDGVNDAIFVHDAVTGDVLDVNRRACEIFGFTAEEFRRLGLAVLGTDQPPYTQEDTVAWLKKAAATGHEIFDWQSRTSDGRLIAQEVSLQAASLDGRDCVLATVRDITERQRTRAALVESEERVHASEERLRAVLSSSPLGIALIDRDEIVQIWNPAMEETFGWTAAEVLGRPWPAVPLDKRAESADMQRRWMRGERLGVMDLVRQRKDGSLVDLEFHYAPVFDAAGAVIGSMAIMRDIAEEKRVQEQLASQANALRERDEELQAVIQAAPMAIIRVDLEERVMLWNPAAEEMFGWTEEEVLGRPIPFVSPDLREESERHRLMSLRGESVRGEEIVRRRKDGGSVECQRWTVPMYGRDGSVVGVMGLMRDIAQEKRMQAMLRQSQKMEAVGRLAGGIAHDFNNLLTAIIGYSDMALTNAEPDCPSRDDVREIMRAAERASGLTRQILAFSRRQPLQPKLLSLSRTLQGMGSLLRRTLGEDIEFVTRLDPDVGLTQVDPQQLEQVLMNLAVNARDAMPEGGCLTVETASVELGHTYCAVHPEVQRHRPRHGRRHHVPSVRAVLHHQAAR